MRKTTQYSLTTLLIGILSLMGISAHQAYAEQNAPGVKEWTMLVFLNGNNNLDTYGGMNINQMEQVGSSQDLNILVQWASLRNKKTQRLYVTKDNDTNKVTSPVVDLPGNVDMGDWHSLVDFVQWAVKNYPAKHYFIDVWDHGSGWHAMTKMGKLPLSFKPMDISWDDNTGNSITTEQLGQALAESAKIMGHKVDFYASDACLMAMAEVGEEVAESVDIFAGSEEVEPGAGWPYQNFLTKWATKPNSNASEVATYLTAEYLAAYTGGVYGNKEVTFSAFDLAKNQELNKAISQLGSQVQALNSADRAKVQKAANDTLRFTYSDYADLADFLNLSEKANVADLGQGVIQPVRDAMKNYVIANGTTPRFSRAGGVAIWLPKTLSTYNRNAERYQALKFNVQTQWGRALESLLK